jgi:hypothetical protein
MSEALAVYEEHLTGVLIESDLAKLRTTLVEIGIIADGDASGVRSFAFEHDQKGTPVYGLLNRKMTSPSGIVDLAESGKQFVLKGWQRE